MGARRSSRGSGWHAALLLTLQGKCSLENRIADGMGEGGDDRTGAALGVEHLLPKWNGLEAVQRGRVQHRPRQGLGIVFDISPSKMCAERITMFLRSNFHASPPIREADIAERLTRLLHQRRRSTRVASDAQRHRSLMKACSARADCGGRRHLCKTLPLQITAW